MFKFLFKTSCFFTLLLLLGFIAFQLFDSLYPVLQVKKTKTFSKLVVDKNGQPLRAFADAKGIWRYPTNLNQVAPEYLQALIHYEDRFFWQHHGINPLSMLRAAQQWMINGKVISGGSTLTMQVARILEPHQRSIFGKLWQMLRAYQLEYHYSKQDILNLYLNFAPFGGPIEGVEAAAYTYLSKSAANLTVAEAALMAVLPQSPSRLRPDRHAERAEKARNKVLKRLQSFGVWQPSKVTAAMQEPVVAHFNARPMHAPLLARYLVNNNQSNKNVNDHLIHSTIDLNIQLAVADLVKDYLHQFSENTSASAMLMNNQTLDVIAYVGAADFANKKRFGHLDMNRAVRSPGSTLKPFIYAMAIDKNLIHSESLLQDVPLHFGDYSPENFSKNFSGAVSVSEALQKSLNIPAVQVLEHLDPFLLASQLENAGLKLYLPKGSRPSLSIALGGVGIKMPELMSLYRALSGSGLAGKPRYLKSDPIEERYLISPETAWIISEILAEVPLEPYQKNPYLKKNKRWLAHKTGTSYGYRDAWMVVVTEQLTLAVWVGKPDGTPSPGEFGRKTAAPLVKRILNLFPQIKITKRQMPKKVTQELICWPLGLAATITEKTHCHQRRLAYLIDKVSPATLFEKREINSSYLTPMISQQNPMTLQLNKKDGLRSFNACYSGETEFTSVALWPAKLDYWLPKVWQRNQLLPAFTKSCQHILDLSPELAITGVKNLSRITQPPNNQNSLQLTLAVIANVGRLTWLVNGKKIAQTNHDEGILLDNLTQGDYSVFVFNSQGQMGKVEFEVL